VRKLKAQVAAQLTQLPAHSGVRQGVAALAPLKRYEAFKKKKSMHSLSLSENARESVAVRLPSAAQLARLADLLQSWLRC
jgi:hypothetical protein